MNSKSEAIDSIPYAVTAMVIEPKIDTSVSMGKLGGIERISCVSSGIKELYCQTNSNLSFGSDAIRHLVTISIHDIEPLMTFPHNPKLKVLVREYSGRHKLPEGPTVFVSPQATNVIDWSIYPTINICFDYNEHQDFPANTFEVVARGKIMIFQFEHFYQTIRPIRYIQGPDFASLDLAQQTEADTQPLLLPFNSTTLWLLNDEAQAIQSKLSASAQSQKIGSELMRILSLVSRKIIDAACRGELNTTFAIPDTYSNLGIDVRAIIQAHMPACDLRLRNGFIEFSIKRPQ